MCSSRCTFVSIILLLVGIGCLPNSSVEEREEKRFLIEVEGIIGYIDSSGKEVIKPQFRNGGEFSEGLAAVRPNGSYGYINIDGKFVIQPKYDYAESFQEGFAVVYKNGKPFYINKKGQQSFNCPYTEIKPFTNGRARVKSVNGYWGVINKSGKLLIDTVYHSISKCNNGLVHLYGPSAYSSSGSCEMLMDTNGVVVVGCDKYDGVGEFYDGYYKVRIKTDIDTDNQNRMVSFVDSAGKLVFSKPENEDTVYWATPQEGMLQTRFTHPAYIRKRQSGSPDKVPFEDYYGYTSLSGAPIFNDTNWQRTTDFYHGKAFVKNTNGKWMMIDKYGKSVNKELIEDLNDRNTFKFGLAVVKQGCAWGVMDTNGKFICTPRFKRIHYRDVINGAYILYANQEYNNSTFKVGLATVEGTILTKDIINDFDERGFVNGLLRCIIDYRLAYVNTAGKVVWQAPLSTLSKLRAYNIDYISSGYFTDESLSLPNKKKKYTGIDTTPYLVSDKVQFSHDGLTVMVETSTSAVWLDAFKGVTVLVANLTPQDANFLVLDGRLKMTVQALNSYNTWVDIDRVRSVFCGGSVRIISLPSGRYWRFTAPLHSGSIKTQLRIAVAFQVYDLKEETQIDSTIYSNTYSASVNPAQFWRKRMQRPDPIFNNYLVH